MCHLWPGKRQESDAWFLDRALIRTLRREIHEPDPALAALAIADLPASSDVLPIPVAGVVVDSSGRPLRDAEIWLTKATRVAEDRRSSLELSWSAMQSEDEQTPVHVVTRTDAEGRFRLEVPVDFTARSEPVPLAVWAIHGDSAVAVERLPRILRSDDPPLRLSVGPAARTELTLADPDGQPIAEAGVVPTRVMEMPVPDALGRRFAGMTDRQGRFVLSGLSRGAVGEVRVETPSLGIQRVVVYGDGKRTIALAPVGVVSGRLIAPDDFATYQRRQDTSEVEGRRFRRFGYRRRG